MSSLDSPGQRVCNCGDCQRIERAKHDELAKLELRVDVLERQLDELRRQIG